MDLPLLDTDLKFFNVHDRDYVLDIPSSTLFEIHPGLKKILEPSVHNRSLDFLEDLKREINFLDWVEMTGEIKYMIDHRYLTIHSSKIMPYELKEQKVNSITLNICHDCNMQCSYCYQKSGSFGQEPEYMNKSVASKSIEFLFKESPDSKVFLNISGGEPLLNFDLVKYIMQIGREQQEKYEKELVITLTTNGTLLQNSYLEYLIHHDVSLVISLDGPIDDHNRMRAMANGRPSFDLIRDRLQKVKESGIKYRIKGILHHYNAKSFTEMLEMYEKEDYQSISIEPIIAKMEEPHALTNEDLDLINDYLHKLFHSFLKKDQFPQRISNITSAVSCISCRQNRGYTCGAGKSYFCISPNGNIYPCHLLVNKKEFNFGNILEENLNQELRKAFYQPLHVLNKDSCKNCWARYLCGGGCVGENYLVFNNLQIPYEPRCQLTRKSLETAIHIYCSSLQAEEKIDFTPERRKSGREIYKIS